MASPSTGLTYRKNPINVPFMDEPSFTFAERVEAFLAETGLAPSTFGSKACSDPNFIPDLRKGKREFKPSTVRRIEKFMHDYRLPGAAPVEANVNKQLDPSQVTKERAA